VDWGRSRHGSVGGKKYWVVEKNKKKKKKEKKEKGNGEKRNTNRRSKDKLLPAVNAS
jgi:hypothetical protein